MTRQELEHLIRAAGDIADDDTLLERADLMRLSEDRKARLRGLIRRYEN